MGTDFVVANLDLREYIELNAFGDDDRWPVGRTFHADSYLHCYAISFLTTGVEHFSGNRKFRGRWATHKVEFPPDTDEEFYETQLPQFSNISVPLIDELSDEESFCREILRRASLERIWCPVTTILLTLVDDSRYERFKRTAERSLREEWPDTLASLRRRFSESEETIKEYEN